MLKRSNFSSIKIPKAVRKNVAGERQTDAYNTMMYYTKVYKAGRSFLIRIPKSAVDKLGLKPGDIVIVEIRKANESRAF